MTLIAFVGSVFSPYYAWARAHGRGDPLNHCALNVALYGPRAARWSMTERGRAWVTRDTHSLSIGPSALSWDGNTLVLTIDEIGAPLPRPIRGTVRVTPLALGERSYFLDGAGRHCWTPLAPCARVELSLSEPALRWSGVAYVDSNSGMEPLEDAFVDWTWSRTSLPDSTVVLYEVAARPAAEPAARSIAVGRAAAPRCMALRFAPDATAETFEPPPLVELPGTRWGIARRTRADAGRGARVRATLEDAPFYSRSVLDTHLLGATAPAIHESLDLDRFRASWVRCLLPFRMPRRIF